MQIRSLHIENFGKMHDFDLNLTDGLNAICASNGWGKSTLAAFIKAMFYGLDYTAKRSLKENERKKYMPWQGGMFGGSMEFLAGEKAYRAERSFGAKEKEDSFVLYDLSTGLVSEDYSERLGEELFHLDRAAFERSSFFAQQDFAVSLNDSLNAGLTHVEEDAGDMQNYEKAAASLEERMKYYQKTGNRGQIARLNEERGKVREELIRCRNKEKAVGEWKARITEKEQQEQELLDHIRQLETEVQKIQEYGEKAAKKEQYELLRQQAFGKEEQLRQTAAALAEYTAAPAKEEELDECREKIYRLSTLRMKEEEALSKVKEEEEKFSCLQKEKEQIKRPGIIRYLPAVVLLAAGMGILVSGWFLIKDGEGAVLKYCLPGTFLFGAGLAAAFREEVKRHRGKKEINALEIKCSDGQKMLEKKRKEHTLLREQRESVEKQVCRFLYIREGTDFKEMEYRWKLERKASQEYWMLKQSYESRRKEAGRSRNAYLQFCAKFSEEELADILNVKKPDKEPEELQGELKKYRSMREAVLKEQRDLFHQMKLLEEQAERIPELEEEEERITQKLEEAVREYGILEKTLKYLKAAREQFSTRYLKELKKGLVHYLELLEPEEKVVPSLDVKLKLKVQEAGALRETGYFSAGWQDLFQIAERFAIVDVLYKEEQPVLVLDDPFVNLDAEKKERAVGLLKQLSEKRQIIYFSCFMNNG